MQILLCSVRRSIRPFALIYLAYTCRSIVYKSITATHLNSHNSKYCDIIHFDNPAVVNKFLVLQDVIHDFHTNLEIFISYDLTPHQ